MTEPKEETTKGIYSYQFSLSIGFSGAEQLRTFHISEAGLDDDEWDALSEEDRREALDESLQDWRAGLINCEWKAKQ